VIVDIEASEIVPIGLALLVHVLVSLLTLKALRSYQLSMLTLKPLRLRPCLVLKVYELYLN